MQALCSPRKTTRGRADCPSGNPAPLHPPAAGPCCIRVSRKCQDSFLFGVRSRPRYRSVRGVSAFRDEFSRCDGRLGFVRNRESPAGGTNLRGEALLFSSMDHRAAEGIACQGRRLRFLPSA